ncbi:MmpS family transport accessory protein [Mycobacterium sp. MUNTM1]
MTKFFGQVWLPVLVALSVAIGGIAVSELRTVFGSHPVLVTPESSDSAEAFNPKIVTYEVSGGSVTAVINYLDLDSKPQRVEHATLPWSLTLRTTAPAATPNILAQGDGDSINCRIKVDDKVKDERTATGQTAETFCLVKSA